MIKKFLKKFSRFILRKWAGELFDVSTLKITFLFQHAIMQKIFRFNSHVPWPVHWSSRILAPQNIIHGNRRPGMSIGCHIDGRNGITFGKNVWVGPHVSIISKNHNILDYNKYINDKPITIGDNCWLGTQSIILPGVTLGPHTIVGAGAIVTKSFPEGDQILVGNPARVIKKIPPYKQSL